MSSTLSQNPESNPTTPSHISQESNKSKPHHEEKPKPVSAAPEGGQERLKRHRVEISGRVRIPDTWGQEDLLKDWIDCAAFDASLVSSTILMARDSLAQQRRRANSNTLTIHN